MRAVEELLVTDAHVDLVLVGGWSFDNRVRDDLRRWMVDTVTKGDIVDE
jgi:hypothetical protein